MARWTTFHCNFRVGVEAHFNGAWLGWVASDEAHVLKRLEVIVHRGGGVEADGLADLADRRWVPTVLHGLFDDKEDLALAVSKGFRHGDERTGVRGWGQTPVRRTNVWLGG